MPVPVLEKTIQILDHLLEHKEPLALTEIYSTLKLSKATAYNILETLALHGLVQKEEHRGGYSLGKGFIVYANAIEKRSDHIGKIRALMRTAAHELKETMKLSTLHGESAYVLDVVIPENGYPVHSSPGRSFPLYAGGASKVLLARQNEAYFRDYLKRHGADIKRVFGSMMKFESVIDTVRKEHAAVDDGEFESTVGAVAVDVTAEENMPLAVSCVFHRSADIREKVSSVRAVMERVFSVSSARHRTGSR
ncbi:MAG: IclR family transcriptional regulator C-terminal domain-containing protein [Spirochaetota bacterium]